MISVQKGVRMIPGTSFTEAEDETLVRLLGLLAKDGGRTATQESFLALIRAVCRTADELVITCPQTWEDPRDLLTPPLVLLYMYGSKESRGKFAPHWTLPGGYELLSDEAAADVVRRIGKKELEADVKYTGKVLFDHKWRPGEHSEGGMPHSWYLWCTSPG